MAALAEWSTASTLLLGDRTYKLGSDTTSEYGRSVKSLEKPRGGRRPAGLEGMWGGVRYQMYEAKDGHVLFMASEQAFRKNFCVGVGRMEVFEKWPGSKYADHARNNEELQLELKQIFLMKTCNEWLDFSKETTRRSHP